MGAGNFFADFKLESSNLELSLRRVGAPGLQVGELGTGGWELETPSPTSNLNLQT
jgi:hypothetical protein